MRSALPSHANSCRSALASQPPQAPARRQAAGGRLQPRECGAPTSSLGAAPLICLPDRLLMLRRI
jgi:hypothetical protein